MDEPDPDPPEPKEAPDLGICVAMGICFALPFGAAFGNVGMALPFGMLAGLLYHGLVARRSGGTSE